MELVTSQSVSQSTSACEAGGGWREIAEDKEDLGREEEGEWERVRAARVAIGGISWNTRPVLGRGVPRGPERFWAQMSLSVDLEAGVYGRCPGGSMRRGLCAGRPLAGFLQVGGTRGAASAVGIRDGLGGDVSSLAGRTASQKQKIKEVFRFFERSD
jgi:hypothetical protein